LRYGAGGRHGRAFSRGLAIEARRFARRGARANLGPPRGQVAPGVPALPGGVPEMPGVRLECQVAQMEDPIAFAPEYPGASRRA
jgi:hypothetical protein